MRLIITLNQNELRLEIRQKGRVLDFETASYYHDLSEVLITFLDKLLKRNNIDPVRHLRHNRAKRRIKAMSNGVDTTALNSFKIRGNTGKNSTSYKIAAAFIEGLKTFMK